MTIDKIFVKAQILSVINICERAMRDCNIELISKKDSFIIGKTVPTPFSWGEEICIKLQQTEDGVEIEINSEPVARFIDFKKGKDSFKCLLTALKEQIKKSNL
jgi:hypothetical protein